MLIALFMEEVECQSDLGGIEAGVVLRQSSVSLHVVHQVTSIHTLDHEEQPLRSREKDTKKICNILNASIIVLKFTCFLSESLSVDQQGRDGWRLGQTHASLSAPNLCPTKKVQVNFDCP